MIIAIALVVLTGGLPNISTQSATGTPTNIVSNKNTPTKQINPQVVPAQTTGIQTPGKEGNIAVSLSSYVFSGQNILVGNTRAPFIAVEVTAQGSDLDVQRIRVNLGSGAAGANLVSQVFSTIYILNSAYQVLASSPLNQSTVNRETNGATNTYSITLGGFHLNVPQNNSRTLIVAFDTYSAVDSIYRTTYTVSIDANGIRAVDGANINHTGPIAPISRTQTIIGGQFQNNLIN